MTPDEIRTQLENAEGLPAQALAAAVAQASAIAPDVIALIGKVTDGICLLPRQENLLFFGLHALAAARETCAYTAFVALLRRPEHELERLFGDGLTETGVGLLLGLYDGNADPIYEAIEDPATDGMVKWSLFQVLARLAWEGRTPRERLVALIDRFDRDGMAPSGDAAWEGWQDAIMYLGLAAFEERVRAGWKAGRILFQNDADRREWISQLEHAVAQPEDPQRFLDDQVVPVTDPVESLAWTAQTRGAARKGANDPEDPAQAIELSANEQDWLACFLASDQAPATALDLEQLDGFFTALVAGPAMVMPSEYMGRIWGTENGEGPVFDSREQAEFVTTLLMRHWNTIAVRLDARYPHIPFMFAARPEERGRRWAEGFILGLYLRRDAWTPLMDHEEASVLVGSITALVADAYGQNDGTLTPKMRADFLEALPATIFAISSFWKDGTVPRLRQEPARSTKIGRNEPCPCGSGKKYKKCCGANSNAPRP